MAAIETAALVVSLIDKVTAPARNAAASIRRIGDAAQSVDGTSMGRLNAAIASNARAIDQMRGRMVEAVASFYALREAIRAPVNAAMGFETLFEDIGQKANLSGPPLAQLGRQIRQTAKDVNLSASEMGKALDAVIGLGLGQTDALAIAPAIGKVAVAYRAAADDVGRAGVAALQNLKVPAAQIMAAFDAMAKSGKEGAFELKDMAKEFPSIAAMAQNLGIVGVKGVADLAAALQITRRGAGDASEAATNLLNVMQKVAAPATRKNFKKFGIDISKEVATGLKAGVSPIETIALQAERAMKKGAKLPDLFEDRQVQLGLLALIQNISEYRRIRAEALNSTGMVEEDFQRRIKTSAAAVARFEASIENLNIAIGTALLPGLTELSDMLGRHATTLADLAEKYPSVTRAVVTVTAGLIGLRIAATGVAYVGRVAWGGLLLIAKGALALVSPLVRMAAAARGAVALQSTLAGMAGLRLGALATIATGLRGIVQAIPLVGAALAGVTAPVAAAIAAVVAAIAAGAVLIFRYWDRIVAVCSGIAARLGEALAPLVDAVRPYVQPLLDFLGSAANWIGSKVEALRAAIGAALSGLGAWITDLLTPEKLDAAGKASWETWGYSLADAFVAAIKARVDTLVSWFAALPGRIVAAIGKIDLSGLLQWPSLPAWLQGGAVSNPESRNNPTMERPAPAAPPTPSASPAAPSSPAASNEAPIGERRPSASASPGEAVRILERLTQSLRALEDRAAALAVRGPAAPVAPTDDLSRELAFLKAHLDASPRASEQTALADQLSDALRQRVQRLEERLRPTGPAPREATSPEGSKAPEAATPPRQQAGLPTVRFPRVKVEDASVPTAQIAATARDAGEAIPSSLAASIDAAAGRAIDAAKRLGASVRAALSDSFSSGPISLPQVAAPVAAPPAVSVDGARARGGPVAAGKSYLVGEEGPEIFTPRNSGEITPNSGRASGPQSASAPTAKAERIVSQAVTLSPVFHIGGTGNAEEICDQVVSRLEDMARSAFRNVMGDYGTDPA